MNKFEKILGKDNPLLESIKAKGFEEPSEIQERSIPHVLNGKDIFGQAATGSGKTLAFAAGLINNAVTKHGLRGLVLTPTRELAEQVAKEVEYFAKPKGLNVIAIYGGVNFERQISKIERAEIIIGTPGRILDHINKRSINLSHINTLVLDEADRMLDMGFRDDVIRIMQECPDERQTMLFSATLSPDIQYLAKRFMRDPVEIIATAHVDPSKLEQSYYDVDNNMKYSLLKHLLEKETSELVMVFCNTRKNVDFISKNLKFNGIESVGLHGGFTQDKRNKMIEDFNKKKVHILVATDVAARGLDIKGVSHVYNYDAPNSIDEYTHRIGRTARAGKEGKVINLISSRDYDNFQEITMSDFNIKKEETPDIKPTRIRWMPERKGERMQRHRGDSRGGRGGSRGGGHRDGPRRTGGPRHGGGGGNRSCGRNDSRGGRGGPRSRSPRSGGGNSRPQSRSQGRRERRRF